MSKPATKRLLMFCPYSAGGLADYGRAQGKALVEHGGIELLWLAPAALVAPAGSRRVGVITEDERLAGSGMVAKLRRAAGFLKSCVTVIDELEAAIASESPDAVLMVSYSEYFSPLWAGKLKRWKNRGIRFGAVVHDPVRDYRIGPGLWHRWSIAEAYSILHTAFVHEPISLDTERPMPDLDTVVIPLGLFHFETTHRGRKEARERFGLPDASEVYLSFGHIRDGKNLDQFIEAMAEFPSIHLIVAGQEQSSGQKPAAYYQELSQRLGVADRIVWENRHIDEAETGWFFAAADRLLLTYSADFRSASGVLAAAAQFELPVLASGGEGPMKKAVRKYGLGYFGIPGDTESLVKGIIETRDDPMGEPDWEGFRKEHSWKVNSARVCEALGLKGMAETISRPPTGGRGTVSNRVSECSYRNGRDLCF